jgi:plastocyanin
MTSRLAGRRILWASGSLVLITLSACGAATINASSTTSPSASSTMPPMPMQTPSSSDPPGAAPATTNSVMIQNYAFGPASVTVKAGSTVTWTDQDEDSHTVTADSGAFSSQPLTNGQAYSHTFTAPGTYTYHCSIHPYMHGTVMVTNG